MLGLPSARPGLENLKADRAARRVAPVATRDREEGPAQPPRARTTGARYANFGRHAVGAWPPVTAGGSPHRPPKVFASGRREEPSGRSTLRRRPSPGI